MENLNNTEPPPPLHALPSHVILLVDWARHPAGRVLAADVDLIGQLDIEGVKYRAATEFERSLGGFVDQPATRNLLSAACSSPLACDNGCRLVPRWARRQPP